MPLNVLLTAGSRRVPLVNAFKRALVPIGGRVVTTDVNALSPAVLVADRAFRVPLASDPDYLPAIEHICKEEDIGLLVPTIDDELEIIGGVRERFEQAGVSVAASPPETAAICNDKHRTALHLRAHGVASAMSWLPGDVPDDRAMPLFVKPRHGRGGIGAFAVRSRRELEFFVEYVENPVVQEYLDGPEFTIDMLCDRGWPLSIVPRERVVIRSGVMDRGRTVRNQSLIDLGRVCASCLEFHGAVNIQCRVVAGVPTVFEINPRFSGGIPLTIEAGADFPRMLVQLALGRQVAPTVGQFTDGLWMTSYEASIFVTAARSHDLAPHPGRRPPQDAARGSILPDQRAIGSAGSVPRRSATASNARRLA
jgi:carbamoyl-phosphate synthase large subunit